MPLIQWPWRKRAKGGVLALTPAESSIRYVFAREASERGATVVAWGSESRGHQTREAFLRRVKARLPAAARVIVVLDPGDYQILQLEAPNVPPEELAGAVRWRAMEFLGGSPHDYTLDVLPIASGGEGAAKVIAVAAHDEVLRQRLLDCKALDLELSVVDVGETTHRNLLHAVLSAEPESPRVGAALVADGGRALFIIAVQGQLYFFRRFEFNSDVLAVPADQAQPELMGHGETSELAARSLTQLQRSLDLWDDSYPHLPLDTLRIHAAARTDAVVERVAPEAGVDTRPLALSSLFKSGGAKGTPPWQEPAYLPLLGALLRPAVQR